MIYFATPCYAGELSAPYVHSMFELFRDMMSNPQTRGWGYHWNKEFWDSLIPRARNMCVADMMLKQPFDPISGKHRKFTHLVFVDADIAFKPEAFYRMIMADREVCTGIYPKKTMPPKYVINFKTNEMKVEDGVCALRDAGTGFMCIKREVFERMKPKEVDPAKLACMGTESGVDVLNFFRDTPFKIAPTVFWSEREFHEPEDREYKDAFAAEYYSYFDTSIECFQDGHWAGLGGDYLSEDYTFCRRVQAFGLDVWFDPYIKLDHIGKWRFEGDVSQLLEPIPAAKVAAE